MATRPYSRAIAEVIADIAALDIDPEQRPKLLERRPISATGIILITSDRGLCGALNSNVIRTATSLAVETLKTPVRWITVGRKGRDFMVRYGQQVVAEFTGLGDYPGLIDTAPIARAAMDEFEQGRVDEVYVVYTRFVSTLVQRPHVMKLLPVDPRPELGGRRINYIYEPDALVILGALLPRFVESEVYHAILEAIASEHSARMVAMRNATENAMELIKDLTLSYNKTRQWTITKEMLEIAAGAAAVG
jgi:F-type H+-transporting ATPase subunit gamma